MNCNRIKNRTKNRIKILLSVVFGLIMLGQAIGCAGPITKRPLHTEADIAREEGIQRALVKKLMLRSR